MQDDRPKIVRRGRSEVEVRTLTFGDAGDIPNNPDLPVLCLVGAVDAQAGAAAVRSLLESNGWGGTWQYTVFDFHHYHPNAHEALVGIAGWAELVLGGPEGEMLRVEAGDVLILPAGTGHFRAAAAADFQVCGAYPAGQEDYETLRADQPRPDDVLDRIARVPRPATDPIYGSDGPVTELWSVDR